MLLQIEIEKSKHYDCHPKCHCSLQVILLEISDRRPPNVLAPLSDIKGGKKSRTRSVLISKYDEMIEMETCRQSTRFVKTGVYERKWKPVAWPRLSDACIGMLLDPRLL